MADPESDIQRFDGAYPIALLPVRIETRFVDDPQLPVLRVRVYPDEIAADLHQRLLTAEERAAGQAFWIDGWPPADEPAAWARLVQRHGPRAPWIALAMTPDNVDARLFEPPSFPALELRDAKLVTATTNILPDAWIAIGYRDGEECVRVVGAPIVEPLTLSFRSDIAEDDPSLVNCDELQIEPELLWAIDFDRAVKVGMALTVPLTSLDFSLGFDRLIVLGVKTTLSAGVGAGRVAGLLDAHHHTRGLAFVRQGTPTNNTTAGESGYPPPDDAERSFAIERGAPLMGEGSDGALVSRALGLPIMPYPIFDHIEGADRTEQGNAAAMIEALWPCTLGYFLEQLMAPLLTASHIEEVREHTRKFVRGRGPLPALRVGRVPYGLLPVTSIARWEPSLDAPLLEHTLPTLLENWRAAYLTRVADVPRVGRTSDPDADLLGVLARDASCREVRLRQIFGPAHVRNLLVLLGLDPALEKGARLSLLGVILAQAGLAGTSPRIAEMTLGDTALRVGLPFVTGEPSSEEASLTDNYIRQIHDATIEDLRAASDPEAPERGRPLLYHLLRQAALVEYGRVAVSIAVREGAAVELDRVEAELIQIAPGTKTRKTPWGHFATTLPGITGSATLGQWMLDESSTDSARAPVRDYREVLARLAMIPTAELERLLTETLDTCSHRVDAWITSMATRRLAAMRAVAPEGIYLGAYAWVENLRRRTTPRPGTAGGFIHAPSPAHAAAAAILRNAHLTRTGAAREQVAVDLSSRRVRDALHLLDGVRQGQPVGAVLGYRFERALHDAGLDVYIAPFRAAFPIGKDPTAPPDGPTERVPARDVVNGLTLRAAVAGRLDEPTMWGDVPELPAVTSTDRPAMRNCLATLDAHVDAAADLLVAESIYQASQGNLDRANATLAGLAGGGAIPDPQIATIPRRGTSFTQRVAVILGDTNLPTDPWPATPRGKAEPRLDAWIGTILGSPLSICCWYSYADPTPEDPAHRGAALMSVGDLGLGPLDVLALSSRSTAAVDGEWAAALAWRISTHVIPSRADVQLDFTRRPEWTSDVITFPELIELGRLIAELVAGARPLAARDLTPSSPAEVDEILDEDELESRRAAALASFQTMRSAFIIAQGEAVLESPPSLNALRAALWSASAYGIHEAIPVSQSGDDATLRTALVEQAAVVRAEIDRRAFAALGSSLQPVPHLRILFGADFPILPPFSPVSRPELDLALAYAPSLIDEPDRPRKWFARVARVRPRLAPLRLVGAMAEATKGRGLDLSLAQLPHVNGARWIGLPFDRGVLAQRPRSGSLSLAFRRALNVDSNSTFAGLLLDEWNELIPDATQDTSFAVHHDAPAAEAAQCVLIAVAPSPTPQWDLPSLIDILHETIDLAKIRAVDADQLGLLGLLAPTIHLAANIAGDAISADLSAQCITDTHTVGPE